MSCASCHNPGFSWGDGLSRSVGCGIHELCRKTPTILNAAWADVLFWDGRAESLEEQALGPISSPTEMNLSLEELVRSVSRLAEYRRMFECAYPGEKITAETVAKALATFERTVVSGAAPFDKWITGDNSAISEAAQRGFDLFNTKAACEKCHTGWNFTDNGFHDTGVGERDRGRGALLPLEAMQYAFKTPTLRNSDRRAPFMHNGSEATLEDVLELYDLGGRKKRPSLAPEVVTLHLTAQEKADLLAFLATLTSDDKPIEIPILPH
jgi:cytochrome c peroxidase